MVAAMDERLCMSCNAMFSLILSSSSSPSTLTVGEVTVISTQVKNLTCPVCPLTNPVVKERDITYYKTNELDTISRSVLLEILHTLDDVTELQMMIFVVLVTTID